MAQKLDCVTSTMCWRIVLLEDKHVSCNAADRWQQLLHQQHVSVYWPLIFAPGSMKMRLVQPSFYTARARVSGTGSLPIRNTDELRKRLVHATWAEFQQSVVEHNIAYSQMKKFSILQGSAVTFFRCGG